MPVFPFAFSALIGYLFGALPIGYLLVKWTRNIDLREIGSGRTGGTNSFRAAGLPVGILTAISDVLKAACAVWLIRAVYSEVLTASAMPWAEIVTGLMSVVGHNWSVFLNWGGGAGTGPNVGWAAAIWWPVAPVAAIVVAGLLWIVGVASIASLAMAAVIPLSFLGLYLIGVDPYDHTFAYVIGGILSASIVAYALRPNIKRLLEGEERIVGPRARKAKEKEGNS